MKTLKAKILTTGLILILGWFFLAKLISLFATFNQVVGR